MLLHGEFTYILRRLLFDVQNELGSYCKESQYADAFEHKLKLERIEYRREFVLPKSFEGERPHRNRVDFLVKKDSAYIVIELKVAPALSRENYYQCKRYLSALNLDLALLVNFRPKHLMLKRILNNEKYNREKR